MKKLLFITYYWPPSGKATLHWPLKIMKHLPSYGWTPAVLTVKNESFTKKDFSLLKEIPPRLRVIKTYSFEPFSLYKILTGRKKDEAVSPSETISLENRNIFHKISLWIRMNLFIPDARVGWYPFATRAAKKYFKKEGFDVVVSLGPPHSCHLIGNRISKKFNIPHVPVFIDPWTDIFYYSSQKRSRFAVALDNRFEKSVLLNAAEIVFITETMKKDFINKYPNIEFKSHVLYWGYNEEDFANATKIEKTNKEEIILHTGNLFDFQNPKAFWPTVKKVTDSGRNIKIKFTGTVGEKIKSSLIENGLAERVEYSGLLPYHEVVAEMLKADYLLVCAYEKRHVPGKLFEYIRAGGKIIAFGDDNEEVTNILKENSAGKLYAYQNSAEDALSVSKRARKSEVYLKYDRKRIAEKFGEILEKI